jgi:outer membrane protein assembly factor BamD (BamD/ComL family)
MVLRFAALIVVLMSLPALAADIGVLMRPTPIYIAPDTTSQRLTMAQRGIEAALLERNQKFLHVTLLLPEGAQLTGWMLEKGAIFPNTPNGDRVLFGEAVDSESEASKRGGRKDAAREAYRLYSHLAEYFPNSPLAGEALYRAADIRWQMESADVWSRRSTKELSPSLRSTVDEDEMKQVIKKFPRTKWADLADYHFIENKLCGDWLGKPDCPEKETNLYEEYVKNHPNSPKVQEALLKAASRQAALIQIYATDEQPGKIPAAKQRAAALAKRAFDAKPDSDDAQRAQRLLYMVEHDIATYGNALD